MDSYYVQPTGSPISYQNTIKLKVLSFFMLLVIALIGGAIPLCLVRDVEANTPRTVRRNRLIKRVVSVMNSFSGGVFLGIALVHLLPSVRILLTDALESRSESGISKYPWAELTACTGFFLIVMIEQVLRALEEQFGSSAGNTSLSLVHHTHGPTENNSPAVKNSPSKEEEAEKEEMVTLEKGKVRVEDRPSKGQKVLTILNACILLVALSIHSILEGLALGLQLTRTATLDLLIALALHKGIEAFTISLSIVQTPASRKLKYLTFIFFSFTSPIGIAIGIPITSQENADSVTMLLVNGILQGLATGTFIFVTFIEILPEELKARGDRMIKFAVMLIGFGIIAGVTSLEFS